MEFSKYTESAVTALSCAQQAASELKHSFCGSEHLLMGLIRCGDATSRILQRYSVTAEAALPYIDSVIGGGRSRLTDSFGYTQSVKRILELALYEAKSLGSELIDTRHILLSVMRERDCMGARIIDSLCSSKQELKAELLNENGFEEDNDSCRAEPAPDGSNEVSSEAKRGIGPRRGGPTPVLDAYSRDVTELARAGRLDPVIGRDAEISRVILTLCRRSKNNPVLIGEPGVGKSAIAEGLASLIVKGEVPEMLIGCRILSLDIGAMIAGTKYRGEFEERFKAAVDELIGDPSAILFIDEIHTIVGAGASEGSVDAANILKPALARGELRVIGATTIEEYRRYIEKDAALERRFSPILVNEPTAEQTKEILRGLLPGYEKHHNVVIGSDAVEAAVELSVRFMADRRLPDKAIDLMDEAAAYVNLRRDERGEERENGSLEALRRRMENAAANGDFDLAEKLRAELRDNTGGSEAIASEKRRVTEADVEAVVSERTGLDTSAMKRGLDGLAERLKETVFGQDEAIDETVAVLNRAAAGLSDPEKPTACVCFAGPPVSGRETLAVRLAEYLFNNSVVRLNGGELSDESAVFRLIGYPPGYRDSDKGGMLTEYVRLHPFSVVVIRDCGMLSREAASTIGRIASEGVTEDGRGRAVSFRNCVLVFIVDTDSKRSVGFEGGASSSGDIRDAVRRSLPDCILQGLDSVMVFREHTRNSIISIARAELEKLAERAKRRGITLETDPSAVEAVADICGVSAHEVRHIVSTRVEDALSRAVLSGAVAPGDSAVCGFGDGGFKIERR